MLVVFALCLTAILVIGIVTNPKNPSGTLEENPNGISQSESNSSPSEESESKNEIGGEPFVVSTAKLGSAGDILIHKPILEAAYSASAGAYSFDNIFSTVSSTINEYDYFIANLEVTCGGKDRGYSTYPVFNTPDSIVDAAKGAGIDCLLTSNNHCYDSGEAGILRTQEVVSNAGLDHTGSVTSAEQDNFLVKEVNGIKFGFVCYTYETDSDKGTAINGILLTDSAAKLVNTFHYQTLNKFYSKLDAQLEKMKSQGADVLVVYMHWGDEYHLTPNSWQKTISQKLADMGVDVIIGGHPHVVQPVDLIESTDKTHKAVCVYSMGNFVSNQRRAYMPLKDGSTEDGIVFEMTFSKYSDGEVKFDSIDVVPTWVHLFQSGGKNVYRITPLAPGFASNAAGLGLNNSSSGLSLAQGSFDRTQKLVSAGVKECNDYLSGVEEALDQGGVQTSSQAVS